MVDSSHWIAGIIEVKPKDLSKMLERMMKTARHNTFTWILWAVNIWWSYFQKQDSDPRLLVKILPGLAGSEGFLPKGFSMHLALIMLLLKNLIEKCLCYGPVEYFCLCFPKDYFSGHDCNTYEWVCVRDKDWLLWHCLFGALSMHMRRFMITESVQSVMNSCSNGL